MSWILRPEGNACNERTQFLFLTQEPGFLQGTRQQGVQFGAHLSARLGELAEAAQRRKGPHQQADDQRQQTAAAPVLSNGGSFDTSVGSLGLPNLQQSGVAAGSFYNWGAALLLRQPFYDGGRARSGVALAERERDLLAADTDLARRRIRESVSTAWSSFQASDAVLTAAREGVTAGERALRDAQLRYRAQVEPLTEVLLVQRDLQAARASLLSALAAQAIERAVLERETGITGAD